MAEAVATPEPEMAPNRPEATTVTRARLPLMRPMRALATSMSFPVILRDMRLPARMKKGMASREEEFIPAKSFWGSTSMGRSAMFRAIRVPMPRAIKMGMPRKDRSSSRINTSSPAFIRRCLLSFRQPVPECS